MLASELHRRRPGRPSDDRPLTVLEGVARLEDRVELRGEQIRLGRRLDMTGKFLKFLQINLEKGLMTTLAYGISWILIADEIDCLDPVAFPMFQCRNQV